LWGEKNIIVKIEIEFSLVVISNRIKEQLFVSNKTKVIHQKTIFFTFCTYLRGLTPTVKGMMVKMEHDLYLMDIRNYIN
jgi:hypothetical protein